jgi:feruloyl esterase
MAARPYGLPRQSKYFAVAGLAALLLGMSAFSQGATPAVSCESLAKLALPDTTITLAEPVAAGEFKDAPLPPGLPKAAVAMQSMSLLFSDRADAPLPAFCRIAATLKPSSDSNIHIEVWMPLSGWNGRFLGLGGGGWGGRIGYTDLKAGIRRGYATASTDTGHSPADGNGASFSIGHPEKLIDYGYRAVHLMTVEGKDITKAYYGAAPKHAYFIGYSLGGYEAVTEAMRYPEDYNGIGAGAPPNPLVLFNAAQLWANVLIAQNHDRFIPEAKYAMVHKAVLQACATPMGLKEGIVDDPLSCRFDPKVLLCKGDDAPDCLTAPQVELLQKSYQGPVNPRTGESIFPGPAKGSEMEMYPFATGEPRSVPLDMYKNVVFHNPNWDWKTLDFDKDVDLALKTTAPMLIAYPKFKDFADHGGKMMMYLGFLDYHNPQQLINFYKDAVKDMGTDKAEKSLRVFAVPGLVQGHCDSCGENAGFDKVGVLVDWVENGKTLDSITASYHADGKLVRTRPLCAYPKVAKYNGTGSTDDAANFVCAERQPESK